MRESRTHSIVFPARSSSFFLLTLEKSDLSRSFRRRFPSVLLILKRKMAVSNSHSGTVPLAHCSRPTQYNRPCPRKTAGAFPHLNRGGHGWREYEANAIRNARPPVPESLLTFGRYVGMPIVQVYGQRFCGPPDSHRGPAPPRGSEVFVLHIPRDATEEELLPLFSQVGRVYQLRLMMGFAGSNRGFCFVQYTTIEEATRAINVLRKYEIRPGMSILVFRSVDNTRLELDGIPGYLNAQQVFLAMNRRTGGILRVTLHPMLIPGRAGQWTKSAIVEYESHRAAAMARRILLLQGFRFRIHGSPISVEWAKPERKLLR